MKKGIPDIPRADDGSKLISDWYKVSTSEGEKEAYYHVWHGWMVKGVVDDEWIFGFRPINLEVFGYLIL